MVLSFINKFINPNKLISTTKMDITLRAIITYNREPLLRDYLNILRIIYFLNRLSFKNPSKARYLKSILTL